MTFLKDGRSILIAFLLVVGLCLVVFLIGYSNGKSSGKATVQAKWDKEKAVQQKVLLEQANKILALERKAANDLAKKQKELEIEKQKTQAAALAANNQLNSLQNTISTLNRKLSTSTEPTSGTHTAIATSRELLGTCAARYTQLGKEADELRNRAELGKGYAEEVGKL